LTPNEPSRHATRNDRVGSIRNIGRRDLLIGTSSLVTATVAGTAAVAADDVKIDMDAINAARARSKAAESVDMAAVSAARGSSATTSGGFKQNVIPMDDPSPILSTRRPAAGGKQTIASIPRIGYSLYKTLPEQAERATALALLTGVRYFDVGTQYQSNPQVAKGLKLYLDQGLPALQKAYSSQEKPELLELYETIRQRGEEHALAATALSGGISGGSPKAPPPLGSAGRNARRSGLFLSHKISNEEQSTNPEDVRRSVKRAMKELGVTYLDMVSIHSPLTNKEKRLASYEALLELQRSGLIKTVGVCNYGLGPLKELLVAFPDDPPVMNQLEISPFNQHSEIAEYCSQYGVAVGCGTWSKLDSSPGINGGWDRLGAIAQEKKMTKDQILVRWALQRGFTCVPRSAPNNKLERIAISENCYGGVNEAGVGIENNRFVLSAAQMSTLDGLDVGFKCGTLGRRDGWTENDVLGKDWEPTDFV
jgi:diketogulonate reductase-like aldo/keto reductase